MESATTIGAERRRVATPTDGLEVWRGLIRAHSWVVRRVEGALEEAHNLPLRGYEVLERLAERPGGRMRMCELAKEVALSRSGLTRLVDRLEGEGLVGRCSCEHDGRGAYACITEAGRERLVEARATHAAVVRKLFLSRCSEGELLTLSAVWGRLVPDNGSSPRL